MAYQPNNIFNGTQVESLVKVLHRDPAWRDAPAEAKLLDRPDYDLPRRCASTAGAANRFLIKARRQQAHAD